MIAVSTFPGPDQNETKRVQQQKEVGEGETDGGYDDFSCLLPVGLELDDFFLSIDDADLLPDLEMCPEMLHEFHVSQADLELNSDYEGSHHERVVDEDMIPMESENKMNEIAISFKDFDNSSSSSSSSSGNDGERKTETSSNKKNSKSGEGRAKSGQSKGATTNQQGKRKVKVDWTPDLHRRFVQAVEQLGVDKAVPSRILELMGIDSLTRHNIASHLQKYRSHRKHLLAREAEAASWSQRRQASYGGGVAMGVGCKREAGNPWVGVAAPVAPLAFPTPPPSASSTMQPFRPLHVWGHPTVDVWPKHVVHSPPPWAMTPASLQTDPKFWNQRFAPVCKDGWGHGAPTPGTPFYSQTLQPRFAAPPVPGIPLKPEASTPQDSQIQLEFLPSKETIDAAIGDVLTKSWQPLPLGLKPPSLESVLSELQRQGISKLPPAVG